jgi:hypothetical protein
VKEEVDGNDAPEGAGLPPLMGSFEITVVGSPLDADDPSEAADAGAVVAPIDVQTYGNTAGITPERQPTAPAPDLRLVERIADLGMGVADGQSAIVTEIAEQAVLNALTFGGYGTYKLGEALWAGYKEDGLLGAVNAVNPLFQIARGAADTYLAIERDDYRAAGAAGVKTVVTAVATASGAANGLKALAGRGGAVSGAARGGAPTLRNGHLAGKTHPKTGIPFDEQGFPDFSGITKVEVKIEFTGSRPIDFQAANRAAGFSTTPKGYTWHHHQDGTTMQLVPRDIHRNTGHTGGFSLW